MLFRAALLLCAACVYCFSTTPDISALAARSTYNLCAPDSFERCEEMRNNGQTKTPNSTKNCFADGFCYLKQNFINQCNRRRESCTANPSSSACEAYQRMIDTGSCPEVQEVGETTFCLEKLMTSTEVPSCGGVGNQEDCGSSYTKNATHGKSIALLTDVPIQDGAVPRVTALANLRNPMFQACEWSVADKVCKGAQSEGGHEAVVFCGGWCEKRAEMGEEKVLQLNKIEGVAARCMKGDRTLLPSEDPNGIIARITSKAVCERNYVETQPGVQQGCEWTGYDLEDPTDETSWSPRCMPDRFCSMDVIEEGLCTPNCNCQEYQISPCEASQVFCYIGDDKLTLCAQTDGGDNGYQALVTNEA